MIALWMLWATLLGLTLRWGIILAIKMEGTRAVVTWVLIGLWFVFGQYFLAAFCLMYPMFWIHAYVWMGPLYVWIINTIAGVFATLMMTAIFTLTVRY